MRMLEKKKSELQDVNSQLLEKTSQLSFKMFYSVAKTSFQTQKIGV